ncbi:hypothetical protein M422DRAFT_245521 [Sphaerobolus stellatus SS14]|nr:hypothetical protein M422DRAFT_245521 [Sphaerobolus stellatus SS14]
MPELPFDVWIQIAKEVIFRRDLLNLSLTCHIVRSATIPVIFQTVTFLGSNGWFTRTHGHCFAQLCRTKARITLCVQNKEILSSIQHIQIFHWAGIYEPIWIKFVKEDGEVTYTEDYTPDEEAYANPPSYEQLPVFLRGALHDTLVEVYQQLANLIRVAPNLRRVKIFEESPKLEPHWKLAIDPKYREGQARFLSSSRNESRLIYNYKFDVRDNLRPNDPKQVVLPIPRLFPMSLGQRLDEIERQKQCFIDFMDAIDLPIYSVAFNSSILPRISPASLAKFKIASYISIIWVERQTDHFQLTDLWHLLRNMDFSRFKGLDLSFPSLFGNSHEALGHIYLYHLTSFSGTTQLLVTIYSFTPSLRAIELTDTAYSYTSLLSFKAMPQVHNLGLPWDTTDIKGVHKAADIYSHL